MDMQWTELFHWLLYALFTFRLPLTCAFIVVRSRRQLFVRSIVYLFQQNATTTSTYTSLYWSCLCLSMLFFVCDALWSRWSCGLLRKNQTTMLLLITAATQPQARPTNLLTRVQTRCKSGCHVFSNCVCFTDTRTIKIQIKATIKSNWNFKDYATAQICSPHSGSLALFGGEGAVLNADLSHND